MQFKGEIMEPIQAGYEAYNGYVFTQLDADLYNRECEKAFHFPTEWNLNNRHRTFLIIIGAFQ
jgi:hypothetical protein